jgi:hypothetical protein
MSAEMSSAPAMEWKTTEIFAEPVRVLAVGSRTTRNIRSVSLADQYQSSSDREGQQNVTLDVTESQARTILEQSGAGQLAVTLMLCPTPDNAKTAGSIN